MALTEQRIGEIVAEVLARTDELRLRLAETSDPVAKAAIANEFWYRRWTHDFDTQRLPALVGRARVEDDYTARGEPIPKGAFAVATPEEMAAVRALAPAFAAAYGTFRRVAAEPQVALQPSPEEQRAAILKRALTVQRADPEARAWLKKKRRGEATLADNRFDLPDARAFIESLYEAGAKRVVIASESIHRDEDPPYADAIRVVLPRVAEQRAALFALVNAEEVEEGFDPTGDTGQEVLYLWWD
jgi:hypothetical protein